MPNPVVLIHGWSADEHSMANVAAFLVANGYDVTHIWLTQYISLDDDVRIPDVAKRMEAVLRAAMEAGRIARPFDMIVHSTGGLVAREWLITYAQTWLSGPPVERLLMLAPANFGSRLAASGKSMIGRIVKGWNNWFQTGTEMLNDLELASAYQWNLARRDLIAEQPGQPSPYGNEKVRPFVICGSHGYTSGLAQIANEAGSDGTVRPAAANLNVQGLTIDFSSGADTPDVRPWVRRVGAEAIAFAVLPDRSHSSILAPATNVGLTAGPQLGDLVKRALESTADQYQTVCAEWDAVTAQTASLTTAGLIARAFTQDPPDPEDLDPHFQLVTRVVDDQGQPVEDYFLEFFSPQDAGEQDSVDFQRCVLKDSHPNSIDPSRRCLFLDRTALFEQFYNATRTELALSLSAARIGPNVRYFDATHEGAKGHVVVHDSSQAARDELGQEGRRLYRNRTHLIEIRIPRQPVEDVFTLTPDAAN